MSSYQKQFKIPAKKKHRIKLLINCGFKLWMVSAWEKAKCWLWQFERRF